MARDNRGNAPQAHLHMVTTTKDDDGKEKEVWTQLCPAWETRNGGYAMQLNVIPAPLQAGRPVKLVLKKRD
jgi:hypothetical protein